MNALMVMSTTKPLNSAMFLCLIHKIPLNRKFKHNKKELQFALPSECLSPSSEEDSHSLLQLSVFLINAAAGVYQILEV